MQSICQQAASQCYFCEVKWGEARHCQAFLCTSTTLLVMFLNVVIWHGAMNFRLKVMRFKCFSISFKVWHFPLLTCLLCKANRFLLWRHVWPHPLSTAIWWICTEFDLDFWTNYCNNQALKYKTFGGVVVKTNIWRGFTVKGTKTLKEIDNPATISHCRV